MKSGAQAPDPRRGGPGSIPVAVDEIVPTLAALDVLDFDPAGQPRLGRAFVEDVRRGLRGERARRAALGTDVEASLEPAIRRALRARALRLPEPVDLEGLARRVRALFPVEWRHVLDGFG